MSYNDPFLGLFSNLISPYLMSKSTITYLAIYNRYMHITIYLFHST